MKIFIDANICLDLLDTTRPTSEASVAWYMSHKDDPAVTFYFSGDFITTFYYILTERKKADRHDVVKAIDALSMEIVPFYLNHSDFTEAKSSFSHARFDDFEDLIILHSALRAGCEHFITNDEALVRLKQFGRLQIERV
jgi:predicted nucleic acid-binding protein